MNKYVIKRFLYQIFFILGIAGAKSLNKEDLRKIQLRNNCKLGKKGQKLLVPFDTAIFKTVTRFGYWEKIESDFLVKNSLNSLVFSPLNFVDLGAHAGLISRQISIMTKGRKIHFHLVEPVPMHIEAINYNLLELNADFTIYPFAIANSNGFSELFTDINNSGNASMLIKSRHGLGDSIPINVRTQSAKEFSDNLLKFPGRFILKSDMQGMDFDVLSDFDEVFWSRCDAAVVECWIMPGFSEQKIEKLLGFWQNNFSKFFVSEFEFTPLEAISIEAIRELIYKSPSPMCNLFLVKN
jgi:FkbM family methyltransferase